MSAFEEFGMMPELIQAMEDMEWTLPRPVQAEAIPLILGGGHVMCAAETGSGKTGAFCLPIIQSTVETLQGKINVDKKKQLLRRPQINKDDSTESIRVSEDGLQLNSNNYQVWGGARGNFGVELGKRCYYEVTIMNDQLCRLGWATITASLELGTDRAGFGYGGTGKKSFAKQFDDYGQTFGKGAVVGVYIDRSEKSSISYSVNGKWCGVAFSPLPSVLNDDAMYPCFCVKGGHVLINFGKTDFKYKPTEGYIGVADLGKDLATQERLYEKYVRTVEQQSAGHHATAIILEPTLELAQQIANEIDKFIKYIENPKLQYSMIVGQKEFGTIMKELTNGVDIIIGTPGRLESMVEKGQINLSQCRYLVLDEADRLSQDNLETINKIHNAIKRAHRETLQVCMFSATLHSDEITKLYNLICPNATWVDLKGRDFVPDTVHHGVIYVDPNDPKWKACGMDDYHDDGVHDKDNTRQDKKLGDSYLAKRIKPEIVARLIEAYKMEQCLIFCRTRLDCDNLKDFLDKRGGGKKFTQRVEKGKESPFSNVCLHSGYKQRERQDNLDMFKEGEVRLLICTDVAARGIDIKELPYVINVCLPDKDEDYIHRVGRVGRAERMGLAVSIVSTKEEKVWYHQCSSRGGNYGYQGGMLKWEPSCNNTNIVPNGCCIWYNEPKLIEDIEKRIQEKIVSMDENFRHPNFKSADPNDKVVYGKTRQEAGVNVSAHVAAILPEAEQLMKVEQTVQDQFLTLQSSIAAVLGQAPPAKPEAKQSEAPKSSPVVSAPKGMTTYNKKDTSTKGR